MNKEIYVILFSVLFMLDHFFTIYYLSKSYIGIDRKPKELNPILNYAWNKSFLLYVTVVLSVFSIYIIVVFLSFDIRKYLFIGVLFLWLFLDLNHLINFIYYII